MGSSNFDGRPDTYHGRDEQQHQFTYIDYSPKTRVTTMMDNEINLEDVQKELEKYTNEKIEALLSLPAVGAAKNFPHLLLRGEGRTTIEWDEDKVRNACQNDVVLYNLYQETYRNVVQPIYWFEEFSFQEIIAGKWQQYKVGNYNHIFNQV